MSSNHNQREEVFSKSVRAGKRTYFFDVKTTKAQDYYLTITESKKRIGDDGAPFFEKHKIFLYREDFQKFIEGLNEAVNHVGTLKTPDYSHGYNNTGNNNSGDESMGGNSNAEQNSNESNPGENNSGENNSGENNSGTSTGSYSDLNFDDLGK